MSVRRLAMLAPLIAMLSLGTALASPAGAVTAPMTAPDPVASVTVDSQEQGPDLTWRISASWASAPLADGYRVSITNVAGTATYKTKDVGTTTATTLTTADLLDGHNYKVSVIAFTGDDEAAATQSTSFAAMSLDRTAPTGTFTVSPTHAFLAGDFLGLEDQSASVVISQTTLTDDSPGTITRQVLAGDGSAAKAWTSTTFTVTYTKAGTYTPKVLVTDVFGNSATVDLSPVTISLDTTAPRVRVTLPATSMRNRIAGWRVVHGTATDTGSGVELALAMVLEKRHGIWYAYDFNKRKWLKGNGRENYTLNHTKAMPAFVAVNSLHRWRTPRIAGLTTGVLSVRAFAVDRAGNFGLSPAVRPSITRS